MVRQKLLDKKNQMNNSEKLANRIREVILEGTWIANTNFKDQLSQVSWKQSVYQIGSLNTIAALTYHINYYISGLIDVFNGGPLKISDKYSFDLPPIRNSEEWEELTSTLFKNADLFATQIALVSDAKLLDSFVDKKYGTYQRNIEAVIEHSYYHLGQITLIRKMILEKGGLANL